jgi:Fic family protein
MHKPFKPFDLELIIPPFESEATDLIIELDFLRKKVPSGTTPSHTFFQIKDIFHMLESIGSARIEGNRTTVLEYIETKIDDKYDKSDAIREISNMEKALSFIDENINMYPEISRILLSELHKIVVSELSNEGSKTPGQYRNVDVTIQGSEHVSPHSSLVPTYMDELLKFINFQDPPKYDLIKIAIAHHRFVWIHPYDNGNGRTVRLFTYAMLVKQGFNVHLARILNPTAIFCHDRTKYYQSLAKADSGTFEGLLDWCIYMLAGLKREIERVDKLCDYSFLKSKILIPTISNALEHRTITEVEAKILKLVIEREEIKNSDVKAIYPHRNTADISRLIRNLKGKKMLVSKQDNPRKYLISFSNNFLLRGIINALEENGFLPIT